MTDIVKGMVDAREAALSANEYVTDEEAMRAALLWLANNVSDEMANAAYNTPGTVYDEIAAAIRAAAGEGDKQ